MDSHHQQRQQSATLAMHCNEKTGNKLLKTKGKVKLKWHCVATFLQANQGN